MSQYQVLARKYRPQTFRDVVAQGAIVSTLKNAILLKRTAHAYLFCGTRGTGKTTLARLFAKALNCAHPSEEAEPCNACHSCREIAAGNAIDVLEIDGASHRGIEDIRQINETIGFAPVGKLHKIYLIDEVHMLTKEAFNALLKTLEEPPPHVKFFFCTTEPHKIPATILSRCQRFNLRRIPLDQMSAKLSEIASASGIKADRQALEMIAERSEGSLRDALSLLDQVIAFDQKEVTPQTVGSVLGLPSKELLFSLTAAGEQNDLSAAFTIAAEVFASGKSLPYFLEELTLHFRALLLSKNGMAANQSDRAAYDLAASSYRTDQLIHILELLLEGQQKIKSAPSERTALEMLLLQIVRTHKQLSLEALVERLASIEQRVSQPSLTPRVEERPQAAPVESPKPSPKTKSSVEPLKLPEAEKEKPKAQVAAQPISVEEQSRFDTIMRFAAKELNGSLKKE